MQRPLRQRFSSNGVCGNYDPSQIKLSQKWRWLQWNAATAATDGIPEELLILPPGVIQSCHLIRIGLDCQIPLSEAALVNPVGETGSKVQFARDPGPIAFLDTEVTITACRNVGVQGAGLRLVWGSLAKIFQC